MESTPPNFHFFDLGPAQPDVREIALAGLRATPKTLPPLLFYDARGSEIFVEITKQPEYYLPRVERGLLEERAAEIGSALGENVCLLEPGAGDCAKVRTLLRLLPEARAFAPLEISGAHLRAEAARLAAEFPNVRVAAVAVNYLEPFEFPKGAVLPDERRAVFFPGSSIGNYEPEAAARVLAVFRGWLRPGDGLLIGVDVPKDAETVGRAYNDAAGYTEAFNLNMLRHLNRALGAEIEAGKFEHLSFYNVTLARNEMHLRAKEDLSFTVGGERFTMKAGETIHTECSYKYSPERFAALAGKAGFALETTWQDAEGLYALHFCRAS